MSFAGSAGLLKLNPPKVAAGSAAGVGEVLAVGAANEKVGFGASSAGLHTGGVEADPPKPSVGFADSLEGFDAAGVADDEVPKENDGSGASTGLSVAGVEDCEPNEKAGFGTSVGLAVPKENNGVAGATGSAGLVVVKNGTGAGDDFSFGCKAPPESLVRPFVCTTAGVALGGLLPNEKDEAPSTGLGPKPKLNGEGGGTGVDVPDVGFDFVPKKSGTSEDVVFFCSGAGDADGLPIPEPSVFFGPMVAESPKPANSVDSGSVAGVFAWADGVRRKKPSKGGWGAV